MVSEALIPAGTPLTLRTCVVIVDGCVMMLCSLPFTWIRGSSVDSEFPFKTYL